MATRVYSATTRRTVKFPRSCDHCNKKYFHERTLTWNGNISRQEYHANTVEYDPCERATEQALKSRRFQRKYGVLCPKCNKFSNLCLEKYFPKGFAQGIQSIALVWYSVLGFYQLFCGLFCGLIAAIIIATVSWNGPAIFFAVCSLLLLSWLIFRTVLYLEVRSIFSKMDEAVAEAFVVHEYLRTGADSMSSLFHIGSDWKNFRITARKSEVQLFWLQHGDSTLRSLRKMKKRSAEFLKNPVERNTAKKSRVQKLVRIKSSKDLQRLIKKINNLSIDLQLNSLSQEDVIAHSLFDAVVELIIKVPPMQLVKLIYRDPDRKFIGAHIRWLQLITIKHQHRISKKIPAIINNLENDAIELSEEHLSATSSLRSDHVTEGCDKLNRYAFSKASQCEQTQKPLSLLEAFPLTANGSAHVKDADHVAKVVCQDIYYVATKSNNSGQGLTAKDVLAARLSAIKFLKSKKRGK